MSIGFQSLSFTFVGGEGPGNSRLKTINDISMRAACTRDVVGIKRLCTNFPGLNEGSFD